jgi:glutamate/tyrosine decarboxylase-like PLP-dependent enzyme
LIQTMLELVGFDRGEWQMTTGSSNANMIAMMIARNLYGENVKQKWNYNQKKLIVFVNEESHYSFDKAVNILWIGSDQLVKIPVHTNWEMNVKKLEDKMKEYWEQWASFFVAATAGTTVRWAYDNIENILKLKEKHDFWCHVDGAWGWVVFLSDSLRQKYIKGIEKVDSFTFDFHKMPWVSLICNMLLVNNRKWILQQSCSTSNTDYIFKYDSVEWECQEPLDFWVKSLQCGRRVDSLKLFLDWKYYGKQWFAKKIERYYKLCWYAEKYIENSDELELAYERNSFNICFIFKAPGWIQQNKLNKSIRDELYKRSLSLVWSATIGWKYFLRLLICNENLSETDLNDFFENVVSVWKDISVSSRK